MPIRVRPFVRGCWSLLFLFGLLSFGTAHAQSVAEAEAALNEERYDAAYALFTRLAEDDNVYAQYRLGYMYHTGNGVAEDQAQAESWYQQVLTHADDDLAADGPYDPIARSHNNLGALYSDREASADNCERVHTHYQEAAKRGLPEGMYGLASRLMNPDCLDEPLDELAVRLYQEAAAAGLAAAQYQLGLHYCTGQGVEQSQSTAAVWWREAATQGYRRAQIYLADRYMRGKGLPQDDVQAYVWLSRVVANTDEAATVSESIQDALVELEDRMDEAQRAEAEAMMQEAPVSSADTHAAPPPSGK